MKKITVIFYSFLQNLQQAKNLKKETTFYLVTCSSYMLQKNLNHSKSCLCLGCSLRTCPWVLGTGLRCGTGTLRMGPCLGGTVGRPCLRSSSSQVTNCLSGSCQTRRILGGASTSRTKQVKFTCIYGHRIFFNTGNHFRRLI